MPVLSDVTLLELSNIITPFVPELVRTGVISYGLSSYGYDARLAGEIKVCKQPMGGIIDPKNIDSDMFEHQTSPDTFIISPNNFALARTVEHFDVPHDVLVICVGKSTYARCGLIVNVTPLEPGWRGQVTLELSNTTPYPIKIYANEGICQFIFLRGDRACRTNYATRGGKYMDQQGIVEAKVER